MEGRGTHVIFLSVDSLATTYSAQPNVPVTTSPFLSVLPSETTVARPPARYSHRQRSWSWSWYMQCVVRFAMLMMIVRGRE